MASRAGSHRRGWRLLLAVLVLVGAVAVVVQRVSTLATEPVPAGHVFPTRSSVGLPRDWKPVQVITGDYWVRERGAVVEDLRVIGGNILVAAQDVTLRRIQGVGAFVQTDAGKTCANGLVIEDSEFTPGDRTSDADPPVIGPGGFTVRRTVIDGVPEGIRVGGTNVGCGPVVVEDAYVRVASPDRCTDWHGDGIQGYVGDRVTVRRSTLIMAAQGGCDGTAPFFYPSGQGNTSVDVDGLLVSGGGYPFRNGMPGRVVDLNVVEGSWGFGPVDVNCPVLAAWQAHVVRVNDDGSVTQLSEIACTGSGT